MMKKIFVACALLAAFLLFGCSAIWAPQKAGNESLPAANATGILKSLGAPEQKQPEQPTAISVSSNISYYYDLYGTPIADVSVAYSSGGKPIEGALCRFRFYYHGSPRFGESFNEPFGRDETPPFSEGKYTATLILFEPETPRGMYSSDITCSKEGYAPASANISLDLTWEKWGETCASRYGLGKTFSQTFSAKGDNGFSYTESESMAREKYSATFQSGILYDVNLAPVKFLGEDWYITEVQPPACIPKERFVLHEGQSIRLGGFEVKLERIRPGVCPTCPAISLFKISRGNESFEKEYVPMGGMSRAFLGPAPRFGFAVTDVSYARKETEFAACADDGGHVKLAKGIPAKNELGKQEVFTHGYRIELVDLYWGSDGLQHANLEIRNGQGELEGKLYNVKQYETYTWVSANGTEILVHIFDPLVINEDEPARIANVSDELTLFDGEHQLCLQNVKLGWVSLQGNGDEDALKSITIER